METNLIGLDLSILNIGLVSDKTNGNIRTHLGKVLVPFIDISISVSGGEVKHDESTVSLDVVTLSQLSKFLLASSVPNVKGDLSKVGVKDNGSDLGSLCWDVWFLEVTSIMSLGKGCLSDTSISDQDKFELSSDILR
jgi:hypothetical protein